MTRRRRGWCCADRRADDGAHFEDESPNAGKAGQQVHASLGEPTRWREMKSILPVAVTLNPGPTVSGRGGLGFQSLRPRLPGPLLHSA